MGRSVRSLSRSIAERRGLPSWISLPPTSVAPQNSARPSLSQTGRRLKFRSRVRWTYSWYARWYGFSCHDSKASARSVRSAM